MDEAIAQKKKVRLGYLHYGLDKKQHETKTYTLSPYEMVYMNERYYLICVPDHAPNTRLYRIDRMKDIQILDDPRSEAVARQETQNAVYAKVFLRILRDSITANSSSQHIHRFCFLCKVQKYMISTQIQLM